LNKQFETITEGASQDAKDAYRSNEMIRKDLGPAFKDAEATRRTLSAAGGSRQKQLLLEKLIDFDKQYGTNLFGEVGKMDAFNTFGKPTMGPMGSEIGLEALKKRTGASVLGGIAGYKASGELGGDGHGSGVAGAAIGAAAGQALSSPQMVRTYINMIKKSEGNIAARQAAISIWEYDALSTRTKRRDKEII
jgi:hypothetical protein